MAQKIPNLITARQPSGYREFVATMEFVDHWPLWYVRLFREHEQQRKISFLAFDENILNLKKIAMRIIKLFADEMTYFTQIEHS